MGLIKTTSEKVIKLTEKIEGKRQELHKKEESLLLDIKTLHEQKEDEFAEAILNDDMSYSDARIKKSIQKANEELQDVRSQLQALDKLEKNQLAGLKEGLNEEYRTVKNAEEERLRKIEDKLRLIKIEYLETLVEYSGEVRKSEAKLREVNRVREQAGIKTPTFIDMGMGFQQNVNSGLEIIPLVMVGELRDAYNGRFPYSNETKAKYKK